MPQVTLEALNAKYPTCSTCQSRTTRKSGSGRKIAQIASCGRHHRPVQYHTFINFMLYMTPQAAFTSPIAFGDDQGPQRSGVTLQLRLWPLMQQVKTTRIDWRTQLVALHGIILAMTKFRNIGNRYDSRLADYVMVPNSYDLVPQDRELLIDEIARRAEQDLISPEEAVARFGVKAGTEQDEVNRIKAWLKSQAEQQADFGPSGGDNGHREDDG